jgi:hypothetical protein
MNSTCARFSVLGKIRGGEWFFQNSKKYHGIGQTLVSKTAVSFTPKQPRVFDTRVFLQNHGIVSKLQKYFISK